LGLSAEYSKAYETDYANKLAMINPDSVATSANVVVWNRTTKRLEYTGMPKGGVYMDTSYTNATRDTLIYTKNGNTYKVPLNKVDTTSWFYRLTQLNDSTVVWNRKNGTADTVKFKLNQNVIDSIYTNTASDSILYRKGGIQYGFPFSGSGGGTANITPAVHEVTATAGQTSFPLPNTPKSAIVWAYRNGARLPKLAVTVSGSTATYVPSANNNNALFAGDRITFDYIF
jgi:hypothetical protein